MPKDKTTQDAGLRDRLATAIGCARQVWGLVAARDRRTLALAGLLEFLASGATIGTLALVARLFAVVQGTSEKQPGTPSMRMLFTWYLGLMGVVFLGGEALRLLARFLVQRTGTRLGKELTVALAARQHRADLASLGAEPVGERLGRLMRATEWFVRSLRLAFIDLLPAVCTLVLALAYALFMQPWVGVVLICVIPAMLSVKMREMTADTGVRTELLQSKDRVDGILVEQFGGIEYVRAANTSGREVERVAGVLEDWGKKQMRLYFRTIVFGSLQVGTGWLFQFAVIAVAVALSGLGKMSIADIAVYGNLFFSVYIPLWRIHGALEEVQENGPRIKNLLAGLAEVPDRSLTRPGISTLAVADVRTPGAVLFKTKDVVVEYRTPLGVKRALDGVSLKMKVGEVVGIAGRSGSGKSTLARLVLRLVHPSSGRAFIGGVPLEKVSRAELARLVGYVGQEPFLFAGSVAENIAYGCVNATAAEVRQAAEKVGLHEEILCMPGDYAAQVGERGRNLSGGQKQRLALARVLLNGPPVLVLDEATSALDPANERRALRALVCGGDRSVLLVAHRPAALRAADRVLVLEDGRLVEDGSYSHLLRCGGHLAKLVHESTAQPVLSATV